MLVLWIYCFFLEIGCLTEHRWWICISHVSRCLSLCLLGSGVYTVRNSFGTTHFWKDNDYCSEWCIWSFSQSLGGGLFLFFKFTPYLGKIPVLTNIFSDAWFNHQPDICFQHPMYTSYDSWIWWNEIHRAISMMIVLSIWISLLQLLRFCKRVPESYILKKYVFIWIVCSFSQRFMCKLM